MWWLDISNGSELWWWSTGAPFPIFILKTDTLGFDNYRENWQRQDGWLNPNKNSVLFLWRLHENVYPLLWWSSAIIVLEKKKTLPTFGWLLSTARTFRTPNTDRDVCGKRRAQLNCSLLIFWAVVTVLTPQSFGICKWRAFLPIISLEAKCWLYNPAVAL